MTSLESGRKKHQIDLGGYCLSQWIPEEAVDSDKPKRPQITESTVFDYHRRNILSHHKS